MKYPGGPLGPRGVPTSLASTVAWPLLSIWKAGRDKLTEQQAAFLRRWTEAGGIALEARDVPSVARALGIPLLL